MADPKTRPEFWRNFALLFTGVSLLSVVCGVVLLTLGALSGWINVALGLIFAPQAVMYFRLWRKMKHDTEGDQESRR